MGGENYFVNFEKQKKGEDTNLRERNGQKLVALIRCFALQQCVSVKFSLPLLATCTV